MLALFAPALCAKLDIFSERKYSDFHRLVSIARALEMNQTFRAPLLATLFLCLSKSSLMPRTEEPLLCNQPQKLSGYRSL